MNNTVTNPDTRIDILIVEDSETQADQLAHLLLRNGFQVRIARNGKQGLAEARAQAPTLIISDISMPEMDGFALCCEIKKDESLKHIPVILLTAISSLYDVIKGLDCGADNFIRKPFEEKYLLGRIRFILANRELRSNERVQLGMKVNLGGQTHFVTAERQQIFDLLISTYEEAIQMTEELKAQQSQIAHSYQSIEGLYQIAATLNPAITEKEVAEKALERALDFPGVLGGCIKLLNSDGTFRTVAAYDFGSQQDQESDCTDCTCHKKSVAGTLRKPERIDDCPLLAQSPVTEVMSTSHVSVPLTLGNRTLGVMNLLSDPDLHVSEEDLQVLATVGNQIAIALERANLYSNMEALVLERTEALQAERNLSSAVVNTTGALVLLVDPDGRVVVFNPAAEQALGWKLDEVRGLFFWDVFLQPKQADAMRMFFENFERNKLPLQIDGECVARDGSLRRIIWSTTYLRKPDQSIEYFLGTGIDVTELRVAEEKVQYLSNFDALTGLANRILLRDEMKLLQERVLAGRQIIGFLMLEFSRLPLIRESLGRKAEQELLQQIANRLRAWSKDGDRVGRLGDSSFAVIAIRHEPKALSIVARHILALLDEPFHVDQQELHLEPCIGISVFPGDGQEFDALSQCAEVAVRRALGGKTARYEFSTPELNRGANERFRLETALRGALGRNELLLHYQPQIDLRTGKICGVEALIRWKHPELGMIPPSRFVSLAEETGVIVPIGAWVLRTACAQTKAWQLAGLPKLRVAVNLSARQFMQHDLLELIASVLQEVGLEPEYLEIELTESLLMADVESAIATMNKLRALGVQISIDDFGTGYSSLSYLKRFPIDVLKIDQSFVREITSRTNDAAISHAIISMAHSLGIKVIAEGVETEAQCEFLSRKMCDEIQGFLFSRPLPANELQALLKEARSLPSHLLRLHRSERTLLIVNGDSESLANIQLAVEQDNYKVFTATCGEQARALMANSNIDVIVADQHVGDMTGLEFLRAARSVNAEAVRIILSDIAEMESCTDAINEGVVSRLVIHPCDRDQLRRHLAEAFHHKDLMNERSRLAQEIRETNHELAKAKRQLAGLVKQPQFRMQK